ARPGARRDRDAHRHERVLRLGHADVAEDAPADGGDEQHPGDLARLGEVARGVALRGDEGLIMNVHGITCTASPSERSDAPMTTTCSPSARPFRIGIWLPRNSPRSTSRRCATLLSTT